jgi:hypothetical protein
MEAATGPNQQQQVSSAIEACPAALAELQCRKLLQDRLPDIKVEYSTGRLISKSKWWDELQQQGGWMARLCGHPAFILNVTLKIIYLYGQRFYVHHPLVSLLASAVHREEQQISVSPSLHGVEQPQACTYCLGVYPIFNRITFAHSFNASTASITFVGY